MGAQVMSKGFDIVKALLGLDFCRHAVLKNIQTSSDQVHTFTTRARRMARLNEILTKMTKTPFRSDPATKLRTAIAVHDGTYDATETIERVCESGLA